MCDFVGNLKCSFVLWQEASFANASEASAIWFVVKFNQVRCQILIFDIPSEFAFDLHSYISGGSLNLRVLAVDDILDKLDIVCPHRHLEAGWGLILSENHPVISKQ